METKTTHEQELKEVDIQDLKDAKQHVIEAKAEFEEAKRWYTSRIDAYDVLKAEVEEEEHIRNKENL